ncbi:MAG: hypothetical protein GY835_16615 [bacterium]|nr:hypothetical protein [bacterium]
MESAATVTFRVRIEQPFPPEVAVVANQATVEAAGLDPVLSDDPETEPLGDPTATAVYVTPEVSVADVTVPEGAVEAIFTVSLASVSNRPVTVSYESTDGTATAGLDYESATGTLVFAPGETVATVAVGILDDVLDEPDEMFIFNLTSAENALVGDGLGVGTIVDDDEALITVDDVAVAEGDTATGEAIFTVALATPSDREIRVDYTTVASTATADEDYLPASGTLVFAVGVTEQPLAVPIVGDVLLERDEVFRGMLSNAVNTTIEGAEGLGTILDDELCAGPNLLVNPGAEARPVDGEIPGWTMVSGSDWQRRFAPPEPIEGVAFFFAGTAGLAELVQDVDVSAYTARSRARTTWRQAAA